MSDSFEAKLEKARRCIEEHNQKANNKIDVEKFLNCIKDAGGTTEKALATCRWEDLQECGLPKFLAREVAEIFRQLPAEKSDKPKVLSEKRVLVMSNLELFEAYSPRDPENPVGKRLSGLSKGQPTVVFNADGSINAKASAKCLDDILDGYSPVDITKVNGVPTKVFRIGDRADNVFDENPLYPGRPLRGADQDCDQTNRSWAGIPNVVRVLLRLALMQGDLKIDHLGDAHNVLDGLMGKSNEDAEKWVRTRFPRASVKYDELAPLSKLPVLKVLRNTGSRKQDPFHGSSGHVSY